MSDFTQLPVKDGFKGCFDYTNYNGGDTWLNQYAGGSGINFNMSNAEKNEGYILFPELQGMCYLIDDIGNNFTLYSILKCDHSNSAQTANYLVWLISALGASVNYRIYLYQGPGTPDNFGVNTNDGSGNNRVNFNNVNFYDYCVAAISVCNGQQKVYINGELKWTGTNAINYSIDEIGVNLNASGYGGAVPTISSNNTANVYVKYIGYATNNHNEIQIQQNSDWLLEQYGLKIPEKNSRLAGTDAVAIAYAIARNQESAAALQEMKKAYREGIKRGNDGIPDGNEPVDEVVDDDGNTPIEPPIYPGNPDEFDKRGTDMYYTIQAGEGETAENYYLRIYTLKETGVGKSETGMYSYEWTYLLVYDLYTSDGKAILTGEQIQTYFSNYVAPSNAWYFKPHVNYRYENTNYNAYMYVEKVELKGKDIFVYYVREHAITDEIRRGYNYTTINIPDGATVVHTNSEKPFIETT